MPKLDCFVEEVEIYITYWRESETTAHGHIEVSTKDPGSDDPIKLEFALPGEILDEVLLVIKNELNGKKVQEIINEAQGDE